MSVRYGSVSPYTWSRDVKEDLFRFDGRPFFKGATLVSNNREGTEERARAVVSVVRDVVGGLRHDNAKCSSGAV